MMRSFGQTKMIYIIKLGLLILIISSLSGCFSLTDSANQNSKKEAEQLSLNKQELAKREKYLQGRSARPSLKSLNLQPLVKEPIAVPVLSLKEKKQQYEVLLPLIKDPIQKQQVAFRLADIKMQLAEQTLQNTTETPDVNTPSISAEKQMLADAISEYKQAIDAYELYMPTAEQALTNEQQALNRKKMDAMYQLVRALDLSTDVEQSIHVAKEFLTTFDVKTFGTTAYHIELYFRMGEYYFNRQQYPNAIPYYDKVVRYAKQSSSAQIEATNFYAISAYMLGWSYFKLDQYQDSITSFATMLDASLLNSKVISQVDIDATELNSLPVVKGELRLIKDAVRVMALTFSYQGSAVGIRSFFSKFGQRDYEHLIYSELAQQYLDDNRYQDSARVLVSFAEVKPFHPRAIEFYIRHIDAYVLGDFPNRVLQGKEEFVSTYSLGNGVLTNIDTPVGRKATPYLKQYLVELAQTEHSLAQYLQSSIKVKSNTSGSSINRNTTSDDIQSGFVNSGRSHALFKHALADVNTEELVILSEQAYIKAVAYYQNYLSTFNQDDIVPKLRFYMGEALFELADYQQAIEAFETFAFIDVLPEDAPSAQEAAYAALLAYDLLISTTTSQKEEWVKQQYRKSQARFVNSFADDPRSPQLVLSLMQDLFKQKQYLAAQEWAIWLLASSDTFKINPTQTFNNFSMLEGLQFTALRQYLSEASQLKQLQMQSNVDNQETANSKYSNINPVEIEISMQESALLVLAHSDFAQEQFANAENAYRQLISYYVKQSNLHSGEVKSDYQNKLSDINDRLAASIYKQAEILLTSNQLDTNSLSLRDITNKKQLSTQQIEVLNQGLTLLNKVVKDTPTSEFRLAAQFDTAVYYTLLEQWQLSINTYLDFQQRYPDHQLSKDIDSRLFYAYEQLENWPKAAAILISKYESQPNSENGRLALYQAAGYFEKAGQKSDALNYFRKYAHQYPMPLSNANEARYKLSEFYQESGEDSKRRFWLNKLIQAQQAVMQTSPNLSTPRSVYLASMSAMVFAKDADFAFNRIKLVQPLEKSLVKKQQALNLAIAKYDQVIAFGSAEFVTSANYQLANLYEVLAQDLLESARPSGLTPLEMSQYEILLEEQAYPFEETAITLHETNIQRVSSGLYDEHIKSSFEALKNIMPGRYNKPEVIAEVTLDDF